MRSSIFIGLLIISVFLNFSEAYEDGYKQDTYSNGFFKVYWNDTYRGYLPSISTGPSGPSPSIANRDVLYNGPTSMMWITINGDLYTPEDLTNSFVPSSSHVDHDDVFDTEEDGPENGFGVHQQYELSYPKTPSAQTRKSARTSNYKILLFVGTYLHDVTDQSELKSPYAVTTYSYAQTRIWARLVRADGSEIQSTDDVQSVNITAKILLDVQVNGDDGPAATYYDMGYVNSKTATVETDLVDFFGRFPAAVVLKPNPKGADAYRVWLQTRAQIDEEILYAGRPINIAGAGGNGPVGLPLPSRDLAEPESAHGFDMSYIAPDGIYLLNYEHALTLNMANNLQLTYNNNGGDSAILLVFDRSLCTWSRRSSPPSYLGTTVTSDWTMFANYKLFTPLDDNHPPSLETCYACHDGTKSDGEGSPADADGDGVWDGYDNCLAGPKGESNLWYCAESQQDFDHDGYGDACDWCVYTHNDGTNVNSDADSLGDICDNCPLTENEYQVDSDNDGFGDKCDNCVYAANATQGDADGDLFGDPCDNCQSTFNPPAYGTYDQTAIDGDHDGVGDACDNCGFDYNPLQEDYDQDYVGDVCDNCNTTANTDQANYDGDAYGDLCDNCIYTPNDDQVDSDSDGHGNYCDNCVQDWNPFQEDVDLDNVGDICDNCMYIYNQDQLNDDQDSYGNACDNCPQNWQKYQTDGDEDGFGDACDNCPFVWNPDQLDFDSDGWGFECDNCPTFPNPTQRDSDGDGHGDQCDSFCPLSRYSYDTVTAAVDPETPEPSTMEVPNLYVRPGCWAHDFYDNCKSVYCILKEDEKPLYDAKASLGNY